MQVRGNACAKNGILIIIIVECSKNYSFKKAVPMHSFALKKILFLIQYDLLKLISLFNDCVHCQPPIGHTASPVHTITLFLHIVFSAHPIGVLANPKSIDLSKFQQINMYGRKIILNSLSVLPEIFNFPY